MEHFRDIFGIPVAQAGVIADATPISVILLRIMNFLLSIAGVVAIIGLLIAGMAYFFATGDTRQAALAKRAAIASVIGIIVVLGALVIVSQLTAFFS